MPRKRTPTSRPKPDVRRPPASGQRRDRRGLLAEVERAAREAEATAEIMVSINASLDLETVLERIAAVARELCASELAWIALREPNAQTVVSYGVAGAQSRIDPSFALPPGQGIAALVLATRCPFRTDNYPEDPRITPKFLGIPREEAIVTELAVPILHGDQSIGILYVANRSPRPFTDRDETTLTRLGGAAAVAIQNARLFAEHEARRQSAEAIAEVGKLLAETLEPEVVGRRIVERLRVLLAVRGCTVYRLVEASGDLAALAVAGDVGPSYGPDIVFPRGTGVAGIAVRERRPVATPDLLEDPRVSLTPEVRARIEQASYRAVLALPLTVGGRVMGALAVGDLRGRAFSDKDVQLAQAFADHAALALENARAFEQAERQRREAELIAGLARAINESLDLDTVLHRVVEGARELCSSDGSQIALREADSSAMRVRHWVGPSAAGWPTHLIESGKGLGGLALLTGRPARTANYAEDPAFTKDYLPIVQQEGAASLMVVPISVDDRPEGLLFVVNQSLRPFTDSDETVLLRLADQAAVAIRNAQIFARERRARGEADHAAALLTEEKRLLEMVAAGEALGDVLEGVCRSLERQFDGLLASVLLLDPDGATLRHGAAPSLPASFVQTIDGLPVGPASAVCGTAAYRRERVVVSDVATDPLCADYRALGAQYGLRACTSTPILAADGTLLGTFAVYYRTPRVPSEAELRGIEGVTQVAAIAIERQRAEAALRQAHHEYQALVETVQAIVWRADAQTFRFTFVSREAKVLLGYPLEQWTSEPTFWADHIHPDDRSWAMDFCAGATAAQRAHEFEYRMVAADGRAVWLRDLVRVVVENDRPRELVGVMIDITARKRAEEATAALAEVGRELVGSLDFDQVCERLLRVILRLLQVRQALLFRLNPATGGCVCIAGAGDAQNAGWIGLETEAGVGVVGLALSTGRVECSANLLGDDRLTLPPWLRERREREGLGAVAAVPLIRGGETLGALVLADTTGRAFLDEDLALLAAFADQAAVALDNARLYQEARRAYEDLAHTQEQLLQSQKMDAIGRLAGGIAHDFNNLLTVILGRTEMLLVRTGTQEPSRGQIELIQKTARRAADLTGQLLAFSRRQILQPKVLDLSAEVAGMSEMLRRLIGEDVELVLRARPSTGLVLVDPGRLAQVIMTLAVNARDAMPRGGRLMIETDTVELDELYCRDHPGTVPGTYVMLAVTDTGTGMDATTQARMFEPFFTTKEVGKGTGLGLSVVYGIVQQSGGAIAVESEPGRGSTFRIYLPRSAAPPAPEAEPRVPVVPRGSETILLVEDEADLRTLALELLQGQGYVVLEAGDGAEALRICDAHAGPIHLMVTDVVMPGMSGTEAAARARSRRPEIRVLYMTGYTEDNIIRYGLPRSSTRLLQKPFSPDTLTRAVRDALDAA
ncbi:MAG: GAF domain-containing protein [Candidatus Rokubacteria bacterium]|nr:GAF domain-containing protein [Candidatus Rokubacteria bacterium]